MTSSPPTKPPRTMPRSPPLSGRRFFDEYVLVAPGSDYGRAMWNDLARLDHSTVLDGPLRPTGKALSFLHHLHFSFAINKKCRLPGQSLWKPFYSLEGLEFDPRKKYCVVFTDVSAARTDCRYLAELNRRGNVTLVLVMVNTMSRRGRLIEDRKHCFSRIFSFDPQDCGRHGFIFHPFIYSSSGWEPSREPSTDAFFVGVSKGRAAKIAEVYSRLVAQGACAEFFVARMECFAPRRKGIHYGQWLSYDQNLEKIRDANCIVEIMDGRQEGITLRTMEAICFNKKLLTNNQAMKDSEYYKTGFIQVFEDPSDIDVDFVKKREPVDYRYGGEFSPVHLLEHIDRVFAEKTT